MRGIIEYDASDPADFERAKQQAQMLSQWYSSEALEILIKNFSYKGPKQMKPNELFEELASIITGVVRRPFRDEPVTSEEYDKISDRILLLIAEQKLMQKEKTP